MIATIRQQLSRSTRLSGRAKCHGYIMWHMGDASPNRETTVDKPLMRKGSSVDVLRAKQYHWVISPGKLYFPCQNWLIYLEINKKPWTFSWGKSHGFQCSSCDFPLYIIIPMSQSNDLSEDKWFLLFAYYPVVFLQLPIDSQERALLSAYLAVDASAAELRQFQVPVGILKVLKKYPLVI